MAGKEIGCKKYVVRLSLDEREKLLAFIRSGKRPAQLLTKARILLKVDVGEGGEGRSDSRIAAALETSIFTVDRRVHEKVRGYRPRGHGSCQTSGIVGGQSGVPVFNPKTAVGFSFAAGF